MAGFFDKTPLTPGSCEWCGKPCDGHACSIPCAAQVKARDQAQGAEVIRLAKLWRKGRHVKGGLGVSVSDLSRAVDAFMAADRAGLARRKAAREAPPEPKAAKAPEEPKVPEPKPSKRPSYEPQDLGLADG